MQVLTALANPRELVLLGINVVVPVRALGTRAMRMRFTQVGRTAADRMPLVGIRIAFNGVLCVIPFDVLICVAFFFAADRRGRHDRTAKTIVINT